MCLRNVILFNCGHTRLLNYECQYDMEDCPHTKRVLIPEEGGIGIEAPIQKDMWTCVFKCVPGVAAHDPLIELAKEDVNSVKVDIEHQIEILSVLSTPATTPASEIGGFNFDRRFSASYSRRRSGLTPSHERPAFQFSRSTSAGQTENTTQASGSQEDLTFKFIDVKLKIPAEKVKDALIKENEHKDAGVDGLQTL